MSDNIGNRIGCPNSVIPPVPLMNSGMFVFAYAIARESLSARHPTNIENFVAINVR